VNPFVIAMRPRSVFSRKVSTSYRLKVDLTRAALPRDDRDTNAKIGRRLLISERHPCGAALSLAERIEIDLAEPREDHCVLKLACRRIAGAGKRYSAGVFERERASPAFGYDWT
jgi:hypothetical protein